MAPKPLADFGGGISTKSAPENPIPPQHGPVSQTERAFTAASTFLSGIMAISATQFLGAPLKMVDPKFYEAYMAFTKQSFGVLITTMTQWWAPTVVRVSGDTSIPKQLFRRKDGSLECKFPKRLVMMANHQLYTDWLYLWWVAYTNNMHGYIYIILKESLKNIPIIGWGAQFYNFIFLKRKWAEDQDSFREHLNRLNKPEDPMWLLIFPEGTNLAKGTREKSAVWAKQRGLQDMKHQLLPRSKGLHFCLQNLKDTTEWLYDCTIGYEGIPAGQFGQDIFTLRSSMFEGRPPKSVNMHFRRFKIADIPLESEAKFDAWLRNRWREKDYLLEHFAQYDRFPDDEKWLFKQKQAGKKGPSYAKTIETQIKSNNLEEFLSIFAPLSSVMMVMHLFYGGGNSDDLLKRIGEVVQQQQNGDVLGKSMGSTLSADQQRNLIQQYIAMIQPAVSEQIDLTGKAPLPPVPVKTNSIAKSKAPSKAPAPKTPIKTVPNRKLAASAVGPSPSQPTKTTKAPVAKSLPPQGTSARTAPLSKPAPRPSPGRTYSTVSSIKPDDSISAVDASARKKAAVPKPAPKKTPAVAKTAGAKPKTTTPAAAKPASKGVTVDPSMLMRMKAGQKSGSGG